MWCSYFHITPHKSTANYANHQGSCTRSLPQPARRAPLTTPDVRANLSAVPWAGSYGLFSAHNTMRFNELIHGTINKIREEGAGDHDVHSITFSPLSNRPWEKFRPDQSRVCKLYISINAHFGHTSGKNYSGPYGVGLTCVACNQWSILTGGWGEAASDSIMMHSVSKVSRATKQPKRCNSIELVSACFTAFHCIKC